MAKYKTGDIFKFKLTDGDFMCGRILLDINKQCVKNKLSDAFNVVVNRSLIVQIGREKTTPPVFNKRNLLITACFVDTDALNEGLWEVFGNEPVAPNEVEFPENFNDCEDFMFFEKGEVYIKLTHQKKYKGIHIRQTIKNSIGMAETCENLLVGKSMTAKDNPLYSSDLRFTKFRSKIYQLIGEDEMISYYDLSRKHGVDVARFF